MKRLGFVRRQQAFLGMALCFGVCLMSCQPTEPASIIQISDAWTRPYNAGTGTTTAIYLNLENKTRHTDRLIGAHLANADTIEIHISTMENGIMRMQPVSTVTLNPNKQISFEPGGHHLMVKGLNRTLAEGDSLRITLKLEAAGTIETTAEVRWD